jgi:hypothetical protein
MSELKQSTRGVVGAASILVIGIVIGVALDRVVIVHGHGASPARSVVVMSSGEPESAVQELTAHLDLNAEQTAQAHEIFSSHQASVDTAWTEVQDHLGLPIANVLRDLETMLDHEQLGRLHQWMLERHGVAPGTAAGTDADGSSN